MLKNLLQKPTSEFGCDIRVFNQFLAFSVCQMKQHPVMNKPGFPCVKIGGRLRHNIGSLIDSRKNTKRNAQIYFCELGSREGVNIPTGLSEEKINIFFELRDWLHENNPLNAAFDYFYEMFIQRNNTAMSFREFMLAQDRETYEVRIQDLSHKNDKKNYVRPVPPAVAQSELTEEGINNTQNEKPRHDDVCGILACDPYDPSFTDTHRQVNFNIKGKGLRTVYSENALYEPLQYPLLFPYGDPGWSSDLKLRDQKRSVGRQIKKQNKTSACKRFRLTSEKYNSYRLQIRENDEHFEDMRRSGKLFQQWVMDSHIRSVLRRLDYLKRNQDKLRADKYNKLKSWAEKKAKNIIADDVGKPCILPASFPGSLRHARDNFLDALGIVRKLGKPSYFITFTANPEWPAIQRARDRWGATAAHHKVNFFIEINRVFDPMKRELLHDLIEKGVLGKCVAMHSRISKQGAATPPYPTYCR